MKQHVYVSCCMFHNKWAYISFLLCLNSNKAFSFTEIGFTPRYSIQVHTVHYITKKKYTWTQSKNWRHFDATNKLFLNKQHSVQFYVKQLHSLQTFQTMNTSAQI